MTATAELPTLSGEEEADLFELLPVPLQQACARGDVGLAELLERVTSSRDAELCPRCATRTVAAKYQRFGLCATCAREALNDAYAERLTEVEAQRDANRQKTQVRRMRDEMDPDRIRRSGPNSKGASDYGCFVVGTDEDRPLVRCEGCGRLIRQHSDDQVLCVACEDRSVVTAGPESKTRTEVSDSEPAHVVVDAPQEGAGRHPVGIDNPSIRS